MKHEISYCDHCKSYIIICGECGMNTCSGTYGPWKRFTQKHGSRAIELVEYHAPKDEQVPECTSCSEAYDLTQSLITLLNKTNLEELISHRNNSLNNSD